MNQGIKTIIYPVKDVGGGKLIASVKDKDVNIKQEAKVLNVIQEEIDKGKTGQELNEAIIERFGTPIAQVAK